MSQTSDSSDENSPVDSECREYVGSRASGVDEALDSPDCGL
jgi:hypothetical protein